MIHSDISLSNNLLPWKDGGRFLTIGSPVAQIMKGKLKQSLALLKDRTIVNIDYFIFSYCNYIQLKKV